MVKHYIRITPLVRGIPLCGTNTRITNYADDTSLFLTTWSEITAVFGIFRKFQAASGSRLKLEKTQLLLFGSLRNAIVPQRYAPFVVEKMKLYGIWVSADGFGAPENWNKCSDSITALTRRIPPWGISVFGKIHLIQNYFLCFFNYVSRVSTPPPTLIKDAYKAITKLCGTLRVLT